jgi:hypothetical protein
MRKRNLPINKTNPKMKRERAAMPWRYFLMTVLCGLFLVVGFFFAASQHFSAIDYGMQNSRLRKQIDELETEKRQLMLAREIALSPAELKKAAKKMGLTAMTASNIEVFRNGSAVEQPKAEKISTVKTEAKPAANTVAAVVKKAPEKEAKAEKTQKPEKRIEKKAEKKSGDTRERTVNAAR